MTDPQRSRLPPAVVPWIGPVLAAVVAFVAARAAMLPGLGFWDTAELQTVAPVLGTAHPTGFPTYVILGWIANVLLAPFGEPALRMNLFAGLSVAVAAAVAVDLVRVLTRSTALGVAAGIGLALTPLVWALGTQAEAHALHLALATMLVRLLVAWQARVERGAPDASRWLVGASVVFGLAMGNHSLTLLLAPAVGLYVLTVDRDLVRRPRLVAACALALAATVIVVFLELPLRAGPFRAPLVYGRPETWDGFWYVVLAEQFRGSVVAPFADLDGKLGALVDRAVAAYGPLAAALPVGFIVAVVRKPAWALLSGLGVALTVFFAASYINADIDRYYAVPVLFGWTWLAILAGAIAVAIRPTVEADPAAMRADRIGPHPVVVAVLALALLLPAAADIPARHRAVDRSGDRAARLWVERTLARMAPDAVIVSWWSYSTPLWYAQHVEGRRPDVSVIDDRTRLDRNLGDLTDVIDATLPSRPVYVIRQEPRELAILERDYVLEPLDGAGPFGLTRVVARRAVGS